jgi:hypothetical protein
MTIHGTMTTHHHDSTTMTAQPNMKIMAIMTAYQHDAIPHHDNTPP